MSEDLERQVVKNKAVLEGVLKEMSKVIVGQRNLLERMLIALLTNGHILLEGLPGVAKTLAMTTFAKALSCDYKRIQFTPDLLPADLIGTTVYNPKEGDFFVSKGPIFTNILLADEINRAPAKVQSALLEVMQERQVTIAGVSYGVGVPFMVLATQNPIEQEGTYPLPEAQTDRFMMKVVVGYPTIGEERAILERMGSMTPLSEVNGVASAEDIVRARELLDAIYVDEKINQYILNIVFATREPKQWNVPIEHLLESGASPRATLGLLRGAKAYALLQGRGYVTPNDVKQMAHELLRHRLRRSYEAEAEGVTSDDLVTAVLERVPSP